MLKFPKNDKMINTLKTQEHGLDLFFFQIILKYLANKTETYDGIFSFLHLSLQSANFQMQHTGYNGKGREGKEY